MPRKIATGRWLVLENFAHKREELVAARVPFSEITIAQPRAIKGIAFPEEEKTKVFEILGISGDIRETETEQAGVTFLEVPRSFSVVVASWDGNEQRTFVNLTEEIICPIVGNVIIYVPHGESYPIKGDERFNIYFWSSPNQRKREYRPPEKIWGISVNCKDNSFNASGMGQAIVDTDSGWAVAELVDKKNLYIHHDLCHHGRSTEFEIYRRLLEEVVLLLNVSPEELEKCRQEEQKRFRDLYICECSKRLAGTIRETEKSVANAEATIAECQRKIVEAVRAESGYRKKLEQMSSSKAEAEKTFAEEFDRLLTVPGVERIRVADGLVQVFTDQVDILYEDTVYDIGKFRLDISTAGGSRGLVRVFNLTRRACDGQLYHPHVKSDGSVCFGNIGEGIAKLIGSYEFSIVAQIMLQFLRTCNKSDWYAAVTNWPRKEA